MTDCEIDPDREGTQRLVNALAAGQGPHLGEHGSVLHDRLFSLGLLLLSQKWL